VRRLQAADLVAVRSIGRSKLLRASADSPYFRPLAQLAFIAFGPPLVIEEEFGPMDGIEQIFIFGSWAARYAGEIGPAPHGHGQDPEAAYSLAYDAARKSATAPEPLYPHRGCKQQPAGRSQADAEQPRAIPVMPSWALCAP
jgi:hypothetical protein